MAAARLLERWRTRFRSSQKEGRQVPLSELPSVRTPGGNDVSVPGRQKAMLVKEEKQNLRRMARSGQLQDRTDNGIYSEAQVHNCIRRICGREPGLSHLMLTGGNIDARKVVNLGLRVLGISVTLCSPTIPEIIVSLERAQAKTFKKDTRVWLHKNSARKRSDPTIDRPSTNNTSPKNTTQNNRQPEEEVPSPGSDKENGNKTTGENKFLERNSNPAQPTPPYQIDFPLTPILSAEDISLDVPEAEELRNKPPKYDEPQYKYNNGYMSDGQEDSHSDYDEAEYEKRVLAAYNRSYTEMPENQNGRSQEEEFFQSRRLSPATEMLETRFNGLRERQTYFDVNRRSSGHLVSRRSASDHQVTKNGYSQLQRDSQRFSADDMLGSDHQLPSIPTHEPSLELCRDPHDVDRRPQHTPGFYISDEELDDVSPMSP